MSGLLIFFLVLICLFTPLIFHFNFHYDSFLQKLFFTVSLYDKIILQGGYISIYAGGIAVHKSQNKATLIPIKEFLQKDKKPSPLMFFKINSISSVVETVPEYFLLIEVFKSALKIYSEYQKKISTNFTIWIKNKKGFKISTTLKSRAYGYKFILYGMEIIGRKIFHGRTSKTDQ